MVPLDWSNKVGRSRNSIGINRLELIVIAVSTNKLNYLKEWALLTLNAPFEPNQDKNTCVD